MECITKERTTEASLLADLFQEADAIVVGIGAGMSAADGFTLHWQSIRRRFSDFIEKYQFLDMRYKRVCFIFQVGEEYWAFQSRFIALNYLDQPVGQSYVNS